MEIKQSKHSLDWHCFYPKTFLREQRKEFGLDYNDDYENSGSGDDEESSGSGTEAEGVLSFSSLL